MHLDNHYEVAFAAFLRNSRLNYLPVDESRRASLEDEPVKSIDFIVYGEGPSRWLIDVKGRKFPSGSTARPSFHWQNWATQDDVTGLQKWEHFFGTDYRALFVFMYQILSCVELPRGTPDIWYWQGFRYLIRAISITDYKSCMRNRSPRWRTVFLPSQDFQSLVKPFSEFLDPKEEMS